MARGDWGLNAKFRLTALATVFVVGLCMHASTSTTASAQGVFGSQAPRDNNNLTSLPRDCFRDPTVRTNAILEDADDGRLRDIATRCGNNPRPPAGAQANSQLANAYYYAGRAERVRGSRQAPEEFDRSTSALSIRSTPHGERWLAAARLLRLAVNLDDPNSSQRLPALNPARLELARAYRLLREYDDAQEVIDQRVRAGAADRSVDFERGMLVLDQLPARGAPSDIGIVERRERETEALRHLLAFRNPDTDQWADRFVVRDGPFQLAKLANELGKALLDAPPINREQVRENVDQARQYFSDAELAARALAPDRDLPARARIDRRNPDYRSADRELAAHVYVNLGRAELQSESIRRNPKSSNVECDAGSLDRQVLSAAEGHFQDSQRLAAQIRRTSPDAAWGLGCVRLASGDFREAETQFRDALTPRPDRPALEGGLPPSEHYLGLARALLRRNQTAEAVAAYREALNGASVTRATQVRIELGRMYCGRECDPTGAPPAPAGERPANPSQARYWLAEALGVPQTDLDPAGDRDRNADAYYLRGRVLMFESQFGDARRNLAQAGTMEGLNQAEAQYYLSVLEQRVGEGYLNGNGSLAREYGRASISAADRAYQNGGGTERQRDAYRRQACLMRIKFQLTNQQGLGFCNAERGRTNYEEWLLYEGMFWLAEARNKPRGIQQTYWSNALAVFEGGLARLQGSPEPPPVDNPYDATRPQLSVRDLLNYGRRAVRFCAGLEDNERAEPGVRDFFVRSGIPVCPRG